MNLAMFPEYNSLPFGTSTSHCILGRSNSGKTVLLRQLLQPDVFRDRFGLDVKDCAKFTLIFKTYQHIYDEMMEGFTCEKELGTELKPHLADAETWQSGKGSYSILCIDDQLGSLSSTGSRQSQAALTLENILTVTSHHSSLIVFVCIQGSGASSRLRSLLRHFNYYYIFASTDALTLRHLASFLLPYKTKALIRLIQSFGSDRGKYIMVDHSCSASSFRLLWLDLFSTPTVAIDTAFIPEENALV